MKVSGMPLVAGLTVSSSRSVPELSSLLLFAQCGLSRVARCYWCQPCDCRSSFLGTCKMQQEQAATPSWCQQMQVGVADAQQQPPQQQVALLMQQVHTWSFIMLFK